MQRPTGITILAVLALIGGVLGLFAALGLFGLGALSGAALGNVGGFIFGGLAIFIGLVTLVSAGLSLAFAYGAWYLKPWGWIMGIISQGISVLISLINIINGGSFFSQVINIAIAGAIIYYLFTPEVKRAFGRQ